MKFRELPVEQRPTSEAGGNTRVAVGALPYRDLIGSVIDRWRASTMSHKNEFGDDPELGSWRDDVVDGGGGNDRITDQDGADLITGGSGINTIKDVKGKGFATQVKGNTGELIARHVLRVSGMTYSDVKASFTNSYTDSVEQVKDNRMHMFSLGTGIPASSLMDLASARDIKLIDMKDLYEDMRKINPAYKLVTIPKGTYPKQEKDVQVIGYYTHVIAACSLPEDTVQKMTAALMANKDGMAAVYRDMAKLTPQIMAQDIGVPFHPGAAKWYKEQGITVR